MKALNMYCGARDTDVGVLVTDAPTADGQANLLDADLLCLEVGERCTGSMCPLGAEAPSAFLSRLARDGLLAEWISTDRAVCDRCERVADFILLGDGRAICCECGSAVLRLTPYCEQMMSP